MFSQALNIPTKINKGTVEITADVQLVKTGEKVGASEATLLAKLGIKPFSYGLQIQNVRSPPRPFFPASNSPFLQFHGSQLDVVAPDALANLQ